MLRYGHGLISESNLQIRPGNYCSLDMSMSRVLCVFIFCKIGLYLFFKQTRYDQVEIYFRCGVDSGITISVIMKKNNNNKTASELQSDEGYLLIINL